jgi:tetratricopeptide (TPR) repeat protein
MRFSGVVHEMIEDAAMELGYEIKKGSFIVHHYGQLLDDGENMIEKRVAYHELGMQKLLKNPGDVNALRELAVQAAELKRYDEAIQLWDCYLAIRPEAVSALFNKGFALIGLQRYQEALDITRRVLEYAPNHNEAVFNCGVCELYVGDVQCAIQRVNKALASQPNHPPLLALLVALELAAGHMDRARHAYDMLQTLNFRVIDFLRSRLDILESLGSTDRANIFRTTADSAGISLE